MLAAPSGRSGKTVLALGLLRAYRRQNLAAQPFKKGPDFIDPGWHSLAAGRRSRNLDAFFMNGSQLTTVLRTCAGDADISIIEGAMGLFDGLGAQDANSTAAVAKILRTPVILVLDVRRMTRTAAALVMGCQHFDPELKIAGVILNRVGSGRRHQQTLRESIETCCHIPVIGAVPTDARLEIPDRHLGLISSTEDAGAEKLLDTAADIIAEHVDLEALRALAGAGAPLLKSAPASPPPYPVAAGAARPRLAIIRDEAFCFYYEENLEALRAAGAELVFADSLRDRALPADIDALYIGGGFPEVFAARLTANTGFRASVRSQAEAGLPIYAECGGLMYLARSLAYNGAAWPMTGVLPLDTTMEAKRQAHGYTILVAAGHNPWFTAGERLLGHEFHHSRIINKDPAAGAVFHNQRGCGVDGAADGVRYKNVIAAYTHVNALASPAWAPALVAQAARSGRANAS
jgi:cobyrinic acid a,c-diamide synthase